MSADPLSKRPRMAMVLALLLFNRADNRGRVETTRIDLSTALRKLVGDRGCDARRSTCRMRSPLGQGLVMRPTFSRRSQRL